MTPKDRQRYEELIEVAACALALNGGGQLPRVVHELLAEAADLRDGWRGHDPDSEPGKTDLPAVDATIDTAIDRANELRCEFVARLRGVANDPTTARKARN